MTVEQNLTYTASGGESSENQLLTNAWPDTTYRVLAAVASEWGIIGVDIPLSLRQTGQFTWYTSSPLNGPTSYTITGASSASPIVITTSTAHGFTTGMTVTIAGVNGNTAANGTRTITVLSSTTFSLNGSTFNGTYTSGGTASTAADRIDFHVYDPAEVLTMSIGAASFQPESGSSITRGNGVFYAAAGSVYEAAVPIDVGKKVNGVTLVYRNVSGGSATTLEVDVIAFLTFTVTSATHASPIVITTSIANQFATGQTVTISGVVGNTAANGVWTITVTSSTTFSLNGSTGNANYTSGGKVTGLIRPVSISGSLPFGTDVNSNGLAVGHVMESSSELFIRVTTANTNDTICYALVDIAVQ